MDSKKDMAKQERARGLAVWDADDSAGNIATELVSGIGRARGFGGGEGAGHKKRQNKDSVGETYLGVDTRFCKMMMRNCGRGMRVRRLLRGALGTAV